MSRDNIYVCDRCKKEVRQDRSGWMTLDELFGKDWDLCPDCKEKFFCFIKKKPYKD